MKRKIAALLLAAVLGLTACAREEEEPAAGIQLYFLSEDAAGQDFTPGSALRETAFDAAACTQNHREGACPGPGCLLAALLAGPQEEGLHTPFPKGTALKSWSWDSQTPGQLRVVLSEQYSALSDISLTLADYCIVLTLCQLEGVETVEIQTSGYSVNYRGHSVMSGEEALRDNGLDGLVWGD